MAILRCLQCARKVRKGLVIYFQRDRFDSLLRISKRHFERVPQQPETCDIRNRVNDAVEFRLRFNFMKSYGSRAVQRAHGSCSRDYCLWFSASVFQRRRNHARSERFCIQKNVARARADILPNSFGIDDTRNGIPEENIFVANRMTADHRTLRLHHFCQAALQNLRQNFGIAFFRETNNRER